VINIAVGRAAAALNQMVEGEEIELSVPELCFIDRADVVSRLARDAGEAPTVAIKQGFSGLITGNILLIFPENRSLDLVRQIIGDVASAEEMTELEQEALVEVGNILLNACLGSLANMLGRPIESTLPVFMQGGINMLLSASGRPSGMEREDLIMFIHVSFKMAEHKLSGYLACVMDIDSATAFREAIDSYVYKVVGA
jgi:chemotaxis protein CheC